MHLRWLFPSVLLFAGLVRSAAAADPPTVAVLYFDYEGKDADLGPLRKGLAQMLISDLLGTPTIRVVERDRLQEVISELKLQATNKIDQTTAVKAGKLLGARYLVLGGYFDVMKTFRADARVVEVETGKVLFSAGATGKPEDFLSLEQKLAGDLGGYFATNLPPPKMVTKRQPPKPPAALKAATLVEYGKALDAIDSGDKKAAKESLEKVVKDQPDFQLAQLDLDKLMK
jgi:curli biogenesis system outer membrane secretion channel CsgG